MDVSSLANLNLWEAQDPMYMAFQLQNTTAVSVTAVVLPRISDMAAVNLAPRSLLKVARLVPVNSMTERTAV